MQDVLLAPLFDAAKDAGVRKVVYMSALGDDADSNGAMRKAELHLEHSGLVILHFFKLG